MEARKPSEILDFTIESGVKKANSSISRLFILAVFAGVFIAFASEGSNMAAYNLFDSPNTYGLGKALAGSIFGTGLMMVVLAGGELFTGNTLMSAALLEKRISLNGLLRNWIVVYIGNLIGSLMIAHLMYYSGLFMSSKGLLGGVTLRIAVYKVNLTFLQAFYLGIMCNWLVCIAVWLSYASKTMIGKIFAIFFPIWLFITSGFEHSIANMYYIPAGIFAKSNLLIREMSGLSYKQIESLNWQSFFVNNLIPVTLGNIIGGGLFVGAAYWYVYKRTK